MKSLLRKIILPNPDYLYRYHQFAKFLTLIGMRPPLSERAHDTIQSWEEPDSPDRLPTWYAQEDQSLEFMFDNLLPLLSKDAAFLEIGCNCGRSLNYLWNKGYRNLEGIEIGQKAVDLMKEIFPDVAKNASVRVGNAVDLIKDCSDKSFDVVFCHSVLVQIPPRKNSIFSDMVRSSRKFILIAESEESFNSYPRNFSKIFESLGAKEIYYARIHPKEEGKEDGAMTLCDLGGNPFMHKKLALSVRLFVKS